jgi:transcriptional regulator with XRE-family HTH domain
MLKLGNTARLVRDRAGLTQRAAAEKLDISVVHLCNIENNKSGVSEDLIAKYRKLWKVDLYMLAWCMYGDIDSLPAGVREPARKLANAWKKQFDLKLEATETPCST